MNETEAYQRAEEHVSKAMDALPRFAGFVLRTRSSTTCSAGGVGDKSRTKVEVSYDLDWPDRPLTPEARAAYRAALRELWAGSGYSIRRDDDMGENGYFHLVADSTGDGFTISLRGWGLTSITASSGCVRKTGDVPDIAPLGGAATVPPPVPQQGSSPSPTPSTGG